VTRTCLDLHIIQMQAIFFFFFGTEEVDTEQVDPLSSVPFTTSSAASIWREYNTNLDTTRNGCCWNTILSLVMEARYVSSGMSKQTRQARAFHFAELASLAG